MLSDRGRSSNGSAPASAAPGSQHGEPAAQPMGVALDSPTRAGALVLATEPLQNAKCVVPSHLQCASRKLSS